jgi:hypothetical protein
MRRAGFAFVVCAFIAAAALAGCGNGPSSIGTSPGHGPTIRPARLSGRPTHGHPRARPQIRHFLLAFLSIEVGEGGRPEKKIVRDGATPSFSRRLFAGLPPASSTDRGLVRPAALRLHHLAGHRGLLLATGVARCREGPEPFSFIFIRRAGRWLALAPAE